MLFNTPEITNSKFRRNDPLFLRNQFEGYGKFGMPLIRKQDISLDNVGLIACTNTIIDDKEYFDYGVHFFVDDFRFEHIYKTPEKSYNKFCQYRFCLTPDDSVFKEMHPWRQIESVAHSRWCGAWWQAKGMSVIPTVSWGTYHTYEFCFDGIEHGSIVAISTYASTMNKTTFLHGYNAMLKQISPSSILCYGEPLSEMQGNIIPVPVCHPRQFHREIK